MFYGSKHSFAAPSKASFGNHVAKQHFTGSRRHSIAHHFAALDCDCREKAFVYYPASQRLKRLVLNPRSNELGVAPMVFEAAFCDRAAKHFARSGRIIFDCRTDVNLHALTFLFAFSCVTPQRRVWPAAFDGPDATRSSRRRLPGSERTRNLGMNDAAKSAPMEGSGLTAIRIGTPAAPWS